MTLKDLISWHTEELQRLERSGNASRDTLARSQMAEKIRHRTIMAMEAKTKAGPMWRNGSPVSPEDMPESWHKWSAISRGHYEEASRLKAKLAEYRGVPA